MNEAMPISSGSPWSHRASLRNHGITEAVDVHHSCFCCPCLKQQGQQKYFCIAHHINITYPTIYGCSLYLG